MEEEVAVPGEVCGDEEPRGGSGGGCEEGKEGSLLGGMAMRGERFSFFQQALLLPGRGNMQRDFEKGMPVGEEGIFKIEKRGNCGDGGLSQGSAVRACCEQGNFTRQG